MGKLFTGIPCYVESLVMVCAMAVVYAKSLVTHETFSTTDYLYVVVDHLCRDNCLSDDLYDFLV